MEEFIHKLAEVLKLYSVELSHSTMATNQAGYAGPQIRGLDQYSAWTKIQP